MMSPYGFCQNCGGASGRASPSASADGGGNGCAGGVWGNNNNAVLVMRTQCDASSFSNNNDNNNTAANNASAGRSNVGNVTRLFAQQNLHSIAPDRLNQLTPAERNEGFNDLHGVPTVKKIPSPPTENIENCTTKTKGNGEMETPEFIDRSLQVLEDELTKAVADDRANTLAYEEALRQSPDYIQSSRIVFLRAEDFDEPMAARRMIRHLEEKEIYFGKRCLGRDLRISDLPDYDRALLQSGYIQILPNRDCMGRAMGVFFNAIAHSSSDEFVDATVRIYMLMFTMVAKDVESQRKGAVLIHFSHYAPVLEQGASLRAAKIVEALSFFTIRTRAVHACMDDPKSKLVIGVLCSVMSSRYLCRFKSHFGTYQECMYSLMSFGIPLGVIPIQADDSIIISHHQRWLAQHELADSQEGGVTTISRPSVREYFPPSMRDSSKVDNQRKEKIINPRPDDVLLGKGQHGRNWPGNLQLKQLAEENYDEYDVGTKFDKMQISRRIYFQIRAAGGMFLSFSKNSGDDRKGYEVAELKNSCHRISHVFRNIRAAKKI